MERLAEQIAEVVVVYEQNVEQKKDICLLTCIKFVARTLQTEQLPELLTNRLLRARP